MNRTRFWAILLVCLFPFQASAALFEDTDARRSILDLRARMNEKADKSAMLELSKQNELLRQEVDRLRGQIEVLTNELR
ncbi:MAG: tol-pal system protein YbgF, partial [Burkholderiaceae bacterium]|nr:tol-pal system protein YbgF [Burkholderiaceae bacterium]